MKSCILSDSGPSNSFLNSICVAGFNSLALLGISPQSLSRRLYLEFAVSDKLLSSLLSPMSLLSDRQVDRTLRLRGPCPGVRQAVLSPSLLLPGCFFLMLTLG